MRPDPTWPGTLLALCGGSVALGVLVPPSYHRAVAAVALGGFCLVAGVRGVRTGRRLLGGVGIVAGCGLALAAPAVFLVGALGYGTGTTVLAGLLGLFVLPLALAPVRRGRERALLTIGTGLLVLAVAVTGVSQRASLPTLLVAIVAAVWAWDIGEGAVSLGEQVGVRARTVEVELAHGGASVAVGGVGAGAALAVHRVGATGLPLAVVVVLLVAALTLLVALYN